MKKLLLFLSLIVIAGEVFADDDVKFTAEAPGVVKEGQQFRLTFTVNKRAEDFDPPDMQNFSVLAGPSTSSSTNVSIVNGKMTKNFQLKYTFILQPNKTGKFTIPPAAVKVDGKEYQSNSVEIEVIDSNGSGGTAQQGSGRSEKESGSQSKTVKVDGDKLFVKILVNKKNVYLEEPLVAEIKLYSKLNISGLEKVNFPNFEGFYKQEIETPTLRQLEKENVNGEIYGTGVLKKYLLFPQKTGKITIDPFEVDCIVRQKVESQSRSIFDDFFGSYKNVRMPLSSDPVQINVRSLPSGQPDNFTGGVGSFELSASLDKNSVKTNEGVTLNLKISGSGNLKVLEPPEVNFPPDLEVYDPKISDDINISESGATGTKSIEYLVIPRHEGEYRIPSIEMAYFNPNTRSFHTLQTQPMKLAAARGDEDSAAQVTSSYNRQDVSRIGSDIRYIQTEDFDYRNSGEFVFGSTGFYATYLLGIMAFMGVYFVRRKKVRENADVALMKNKKANKFARRRLKVASKYLKEDEKDNFYEETLKALWGYLSDKLGIEVAELSRDKAREKLIEKQVPEDLTEQFLELIDNCEFARYAPSGGVQKMDELYNQAIYIISKLQQKLK
jgi:hypothetical protein